jgi:hypothetical protein
MNNSPHAKMRFSLIETSAIMPNGKVVTSSRSYPLGVGKDVYDKIDADLRKAFGNDGSRTKGTPMDAPVVSLGLPQCHSGI